MWCDVCTHRIVLGKQDWVYEETREYAPGHSIVTYAAHAACHNPPAESPQMTAEQLDYWARLMGRRR